MSWYAAYAGQLSRTYEAVPPEKLHAWLLPFIPQTPALILDVGAGTGRDSAWLASLGHRVIAVEPSNEMRMEAQRLHASPAIQWIDDHLPALEKVHRLALSFDVVLLSAVWMHVDPEDRARAFRKLINLLKPGGAVALTLRHGQAEHGRGLFAVTRSEIESLARIHGAFVETAATSHDQLGRSDVHWTQVLVRLPDDGTGALPLLRHIILNDDKSSTYKVALLRTICRIADGASGYGRRTYDGYMAVPLGLVGLYWLRLFKPLLAADLPQNPINRGYEALGFVGAGFRQLSDASPMDLRVGVQFSQARSGALHAALKDACRTICRMPATHTTYANGKPIFPARPTGRVPRAIEVRLDEAYLSSFGELLVPEHLWLAIQRFDVWIEPAIVFEWSRLMRGYAHGQGRTVDESSMSVAMTWSDPGRDVQTTKLRALRLMEGNTLHCVWSGRPLDATTLDIDHCIPWSAWPCEDLWNLMPSHRLVNQRQKRERLPSVETLQIARERINDWWATAYFGANDHGLRRRFVLEATASLPIVRQDPIGARRHLRRTRDLAGEVAARPKNSSLGTILTMRLARPVAAVLARELGR